MLCHWSRSSCSSFALAPAPSPSVPDTAPAILPAVVEPTDMPRPAPLMPCWLHVRKRVLDLDTGEGGITVPDGVAHAVVERPHGTEGTRAVDAADLARHLERVGDAGVGARGAIRRVGRQRSGERATGVHRAADGVESGAPQLAPEAQGVVGVVVAAGGHGVPRRQRGVDEELQRAGGDGHDTVEGGDAEERLRAGDQAQQVTLFWMCFAALSRGRAGPRWSPSVP